MAIDVDTIGNPLGVSSTLCLFVGLFIKQPKRASFTLNPNLSQQYIHILKIITVIFKGKFVSYSSWIKERLGPEEDWIDK